MTIHVYSIMRNEEDLLPYFLRHYSTFADKIFIIDDKSTDKTVEIAKANKKVRLLNYKFTEGFREDEHNACFEQFYKKYSRGIADWVMVVDGDEFLYTKDMINELEYQKKLGRKILMATAYVICSEVFPDTEGQIYEECNIGSRSREFDKRIIFDPSINLNFGQGRHQTIVPEGTPSARAGILLLHFRYLSRNFSIKRLCKTNTRFSNKRLAMHMRKALERYERGIASIKNGESIKLI